MFSVAVNAGCVYLHEHEWHSVGAKHVDNNTKQPPQSISGHVMVTAN